MSLTELEAKILDYKNKLISETDPRVIDYYRTSIVQLSEERSILMSRGCSSAALAETFFELFTEINEERFFLADMATEIKELATKLKEERPEMAIETKELVAKINEERKTYTKMATEIKEFATKIKEEQNTFPEMATEIKELATKIKEERKAYNEMVTEIKELAAKIKEERKSYNEMALANNSSSTVPTPLTPEPCLVGGPTHAKTSSSKVPTPRTPVSCRVCGPFVSSVESAYLEELTKRYCQLFKNQHDKFNGRTTFVTTRTDVFINENDDSGISANLFSISA